MPFKVFFLWATRLLNAKNETWNIIPQGGGGGGGGRFKALLQLANFTLGPDAILNTEIHKNSVRIKTPNSVNTKIKLITIINKDE